MSSIGELDESNASLRLLITLNQIHKPIILTDLYEEMRRRFKVGRRTVDTALTTCIRLGLVKREKQRTGMNPMPSLIHVLTPKGKMIAEKIAELEKSLR
jgi:predicted DNA-binding transcriptional regulator